MAPRFIADAAGRFLRDPGGNVMILGAMFGIVACGCAALAVDFGSIYFEKRKQQGVTDIAAMAGAQEIAQAERAVRAHLEANGFAKPESLKVELGRYKALATISPERRFEVNAGEANAVRVTMVSQTPLYFLKVFIAGETMPLHTTAVAVNTQFAKFSIGSRLARLDGGIANAVLSKLLGGQVSLSVMDYEALAGAKVDIFAFSKALATQLDLKGVTFDELASSSMKVGDLYSAMYDMGRRGELGDSAATSALARLLEQSRAGSASLDLRRLIEFGPYGGSSVDSGAPSGASASASLFSILMAAASAANGDSQVKLDLAAQLPGLSKAELNLVIGERPIGSPWLALGDQDATVRTAQMRLLLDLEVGGKGLLNGVKVRLPLYLELAAAEARLADIRCGARIEDSRVSLAVTPSVLNASIGDVPLDKARKFSEKPAVEPATIIELALLKLKGRSQINVTNTEARTLDFTWSDIEKVAAKSVSTTNIGETLVSSLLSKLDLTVQAGMLSVSPTPSLLEALAEALGRAARPVDAALNSILAAAGVRLGEADVWVNGVRCDGAALVQ